MTEKEKKRIKKTKTVMIKKVGGEKNKEKRNGSPPALICRSVTQ